MPTKSKVFSRIEEEVLALKGSKKDKYVMIGYLDHVRFGRDKADPRYTPGSKRDIHWSIGIDLAKHDIKEREEHELHMRNLSKLQEARRKEAAAEAAAEPDPVEVLKQQGLDLRSLGKVTGNNVANFILNMGGIEAAKKMPRSDWLRCRYVGEKALEKLEKLGLAQPASTKSEYKKFIGSKWTIVRPAKPIPPPPKLDRGIQRQLCKLRKLGYALQWHGRSKKYTLAKLQSTI